MSNELPYTVPLTDDLVDPAASVEDTVARRQLLERMFASMDEREQKILTLLADEATVDEIAEALGLKPGSGYVYELVAAVRAKARGFKGLL